MWIGDYEIACGKHGKLGKPLQYYVTVFIGLYEVECYVDYWPQILLAILIFIGILNI